MALQMPCRRYAAVDRVDPEGKLVLHIGRCYQHEMIELV